MTASELYALSQGSVCLTDPKCPEECHWCGAPCKRHWMHDDPPPPAYVRPAAPRTAKRPNGSYICAGCWHWRRKSITVRYLSGGLKDRREPKDHSWLILPDAAWGIDGKNEADCVELYNLLLEPPTTFCLMIHSGDAVLLQNGACNDLDEIRADTPLRFSSRNVIYEYTVYDLEQTLRNPEVGGNEPGVQALIREYGRPEKFVRGEEKRLRGGQTKKLEESASHMRRLVSSKRPIRMSA